MTISTPLSSNAKKQSTVIQWVARTRPEWRKSVLEAAVVAGLGASAGSAIEGGYHLCFLVSIGPRYENAIS